MKYMSAHKKASIEALLFATNGLTIEEISKRTKIRKEEVIKILSELEKEYSSDDKGIHIFREGDVWKMSVKPEHTKKIIDIVKPEMPGSILKTLAVIAAKKPIKQSIVVKIRGNKAYEHIRRLEKIGFIKSEKFGNTKILNLTEKFFNYFKVSEPDLKEKIKYFLFL